MNMGDRNGFSGHSDRKQLMRYIGSLEPKPDKIVIGHGEDRKCTDLASSIYKKFGIETKAPQNLETIRLRRSSDGILRKGAWRSGRPCSSGSAPPPTCGSRT